MSNSNIVVEWLRSLNLGEYAESFLDNGYDDLEICKQVGDPDLDAIGVFNATHRSRLLQSVRTLREEGAASVYFTLEESQAILEESHATQESPKKEIADTTRESPRFLDEYEEGKAELVRVPRIQLKHLLRERLNQDCIRLSSQPYSTANGERGYLEGLGSRYAEIFNTHYSDVLYHLEDLRQREWAELSPRFRVLPVPSVPHGQQSLSRQNGLTTSVSQPIYVPGKYSPSSCLSDREEDEIYGFTNYPVYGKVNGGAARPSPTHQPHQINKHNYQNWLSPRSAYFYEFPPSERPGKKRTSLIRLLRHLKTNRKEKNSSRTNQRVSTPEDGQSTAPLPQDYDKMRLLQKASRVAANTFEETIHRLKVQEAMKKKEKIDRDHEEFLRDIRAGVMVGGRGDDTYMYDEDMARLGHHWYDEPPYESDPEDFLMGDNPALHNTRLCFTMGTRGDQLGAESEVISLRSAGDISLPPQRAILVRPSSRSRSQSHQNRESGDYAASDVNSICSRLSSLSMETSRSEHLEMDVYQRLRSYNGVDPPSPAHSSDYADEELIALQPSCSGSSTTHRMRSLKCDPNGLSGKSLGRRHHHHHHHHHHHVHHRHKAHHHSSAESLPSASSTQALMSGIDDYSPQGQIVPLARALVDSNPYDKDSLRFKKGDIIEVISMSGSGLWRGRVHNRVGHFKFTNVELLNVDDGCTSRRAPSSQSSQGATNRPRTLEQMLEAIHMEEHMSLFVLNGYEDLESFCEIREEDLDYLGLTDPEHRAKILAAVQVLQEFEQVEEEWNGVEPIQTKEANNLSQQITQQNSSEKTDESFLPNIPVSSEPPPTPAPECNPSVQNSKGGSEKSSDSGVSSSSGSSGRLTSGNGSTRPSRGRPPPPPKPSPSYVNQLPQTTPD